MLPTCSMYQASGTYTAITPGDREDKLLYEGNGQGLCVPRRFGHLGSE